MGLSREQSKASYRVAKYLKSKGYDIIPINPFADQILDQKCFKTLLNVPEDIQKKIEVVDIFRLPKDVSTIVEEAIQIRKKHWKSYVIWMQLGIVNKEAAKRGVEASFTVIMDRCMMREHKRISRSKP